MEVHIYFLNLAYVFVNKKRFQKLIKSNSRIMSTIETREIFWSPSLIQRSLSGSLIRRNIAMLYRRALLPPPTLQQLPEERLFVTCIIASEDEELQANFYQEMSIITKIICEGPAHLQLYLKCLTIIYLIFLKRF